MPAEWVREPAATPPPAPGQARARGEVPPIPGSATETGPTPEASGLAKLTGTNWLAIWAGSFGTGGGVLQILARASFPTNFYLLNLWSWGQLVLNLAVHMLLLVHPAVAKLLKGAALRRQPPDARDETRAESRVTKTIILLGWWTTLVFLFTPYWLVYYGLPFLLLTVSVLRFKDLPTASRPGQKGREERRTREETGKKAWDSLEFQ